MTPINDQGGEDDDDIMPSSTSTRDRDDRCTSLHDGDRTQPNLELPSASDAYGICFQQSYARKAEEIRFPLEVVPHSNFTRVNGNN